MCRENLWTIPSAKVSLLWLSFIISSLHHKSSTLLFSSNLSNGYVLCPDLYTQLTSDLHNIYFSLIFSGFSFLEPDSDHLVHVLFLYWSIHLEQTAVPPSPETYSSFFQNVSEVYLFLLPQTRCSFLSHLLLPFFCLSFAWV